jgi:hypothetical protein
LKLMQNFDKNNIFSDEVRIDLKAFKKILWKNVNLLMILISI